MKRSSHIFIVTIFCLSAHSQSIVDLSKFPAQPNDTATLSSSELLDKINWQAIKAYCKTAKGHYFFEDKDSLLTRYKYIKQGYGTFFEILSYDGKVLQYYTDAGNNERVSYFNKIVWLEYVNSKLPSLSDNFKLTKKEPSDILKSYYHLLGVDTRDEYGFICEYSTVGRATDRRMAIIELLQQHRLDLIKKLVDYPNLQTKLYAVDALIYSDYSARRKIQTLEKEIKQKQKELGRLQMKNGDKLKAETLSNQIKALSDTIAQQKSEFLTTDEWKVIYGLRDTNQTVKTCGNSGSYKIYGTPISEALSDKAIAEIPKLYDGLKNSGYFR